MMFPLIILNLITSNCDNNVSESTHEITKKIFILAKVQYCSFCVAQTLVIFFFVQDPEKDQKGSEAELILTTPKPNVCLITHFQTNCDNNFSKWINISVSTRIIILLS